MISLPAVVINQQDIFITTEDTKVHGESWDGGQKEKAFLEKKAVGCHVETSVLTISANI